MTPIGVALVKAFEGCRLTAYRDMVGVLTIGYGHTSGVKAGDTLTQERADAMLVDELNAFERSVVQLCHVSTNPYQADAMTALAYNIGLGAFAASTVLRRHNMGDTRGAAAAFGLWNKAGGQAVAGLTRRRAAEAALYLKDGWVAPAVAKIVTDTGVEKAAASPAEPAQLVDNSVNVNTEKKA